MNLQRQNQQPDQIVSKILSNHLFDSRNLVPSIGNAEQALQDLQTVGLLTTAESDRLRLANVKVRQLENGWKSM